MYRESEIESSLKESSVLNETDTDTWLVGLVSFGKKSKF